ncbi:MAG: M23 family metallopeptidase [Armatimonadota bacterium]
MKNPNSTILVVILIILAVLLVSPAVPAVSTQMPSGFYFPTDRTIWTGTNGGAVGDPKQPWNDTGTGGRIFGYLEPAASGPWYGKLHVGMDIRTPYNSPIYSLSYGTIYDYFTDEGPRYNAIIIEYQEATGALFYAVYGHCRLRNDLIIGSPVAAGETIGFINESVNQHMHLGIKMNPDFSTGWGYFPIGTDPSTVGWRPPRTWLMSHSPYNGSPQPDNVPPIITIAGPSVNTTYTTFQQISWGATDDESGIDFVTLQWDSGPITEVDVTGSLIIPNGTHTVTIRTTDIAGNSSVKTAGPYKLAVPNMVVSSPGALFAEGYYIQRTDRSSGLLVDLGALTPPAFAVGDRVTVQSGTLVTVNGGTVLQNPVVSRVSSGTAPSALDLYIRTVASNSAYNGRLVRVRAQVTFREPDGSAFYVNDGTGPSDGFHNGIRILCTGFRDGSSLSMPSLGRTVYVTGIRWTADVQGVIVPAIRPRSQKDIRYL